MPFLSANVSPVPPKVISSLSLALRLKLLARSVRVRVLLLEFVSTFLFRLVPTLVSLVSSVCSLSALFLSSWFLASLVGFGYLAFTQRQTFLGVFLLFLPLPCCLFHLFFLSLPFCLFMAFYAVGTGSVVPLFPTRLFACCIMALFICMFLLCVIVFQGWICAYITRSG